MGGPGAEREIRSSAVVIAGVCLPDISNRCLVATPTLRLSWGSPGGRQPEQVKSLLDEQWDVSTETPSVFSKEVGPE